MGALLLLGAALCLITCPCNVLGSGKEFALTFMQNYLMGYSTADHKVIINAVKASSKVVVSVPSVKFKEEKIVQAGKTFIVSLPKDVEIDGTGKCPDTVLIEASEPVSVTALNHKLRTTDISEILSIAEWGSNYFIFTPPQTPAGTYKEFAVTNGKDANSVDIFVKGSLRYQNTVYRDGSRLQIDLLPWESVQIQSTADLSGTQITSKNPVAVFSGHTCVNRFSKCNHVYEQLRPVNQWGSDFIIPPVSFQTKFDSVYIQASQITRITVQSNKGTETINLNKGGTKEITFLDPTTLSIKADHPIQVLLLFNGITFLGNQYYDPFLINVLPTNDFCSAYALNALEKFENHALIVAKTSEIAKVLLNGAALKNAQWKTVTATEYSWVRLPYSAKGDGSSNIVESSSGFAFGLYSFGVGENNGYGAPGACIRAGGVTLTCANVKCGNGEVCKMIDGAPTCVKPVAPSTCWASGDPHVKTYDKRRYDFMGTCTYVMSKNCNDGGELPAFEVLAENEHRGNTRVSYVGQVIVKVYGVTIVVARSERGYIRIDNTRWALPATLNNDKLRVSLCGRSALIETDFGLSVRYDWNHVLRVTVPGTYHGKTCGLCGNFNGNPGDDFATPAGTQAAGAVAFGTSWKVPGLVPNAKCSDDCPGGCKPCDNKLTEKWAGESFCGIILAKNGPFAKCHSVIKPQDYFDNCKFDMCIGEGVRKFLCEALEAYADDCQNAGVALDDWRKVSKCYPKCPANSDYEVCGSACPATCSDPEAPTKCRRPCVETCTCRKGFVWSGDKCVPANTCGCTYNGKYVPAGESFFADQGCKKWCTCNPNNQKVECKDQGCRKGEQCKVVDGIRKCAAVSYSTCYGRGDPHWMTHDGRRYDFQGTCVYQLSAKCSNDPELEAFEVIVQNENRGNKAVSFVKLVEVKVHSLSIVITRTHKGQVLINNELTNLPIELPHGVSVYRSGLYAVVNTNFGLKVQFNWHHAVSVTLPSSYMGGVCGLCGNYNGNPADDLIPKGGNAQVAPKEFGASWRVAEVPGCVDGCTGVCPKCDITDKVQYETNDFCGIIKDPTGPFRDCHAKVDPAGHFEDCVFDLCLFKGKKDVLCEALTAYTTECQAAGAKVYSWRTNQLCAMKCPANSHYDICGASCPATCQTLAAPRACLASCEEDCVCDEGHVLSGDKCVPFSQCGCVYGDRYYRTGQVFYPNGKCEEECKCGQDGEVDCEKFACGPNEKCTLENGVQKCHPVGMGVCRAAGDPHYESMDGKRFNFQGTCTYVLSESVGLENTRLTAFSVHVENVQFRNKRVSVTKLVAVNVYGLTIILKNRMVGVLVNGVLHNLPLNFQFGRVLVYKKGAQYVVETDFGLRVSYDLRYHVVVKVPGNYRNKVQGLCGNFNGDPKDDFQKPNKELTTNVNTFGNSWKVNIPDVECSGGCEGKDCPECSSAHKAEFSKPTYCGILIAPTGPFAACHSKVNPKPYFSDCVFDVCESNGDGSVLCDSVAAYAQECHRAGVDVKSWRTPSFCPMKCPANSHYEVCADEYAAACRGVTDIKLTPTSCTEGCECDDGFLFNGQTCVKDTECGCFENGKSYKHGEVVYNEDCSSKCMCKTNTGLVCEKHSCPQGTKCSTKNGIQGCYNTDPCKAANCRPKEKCKIEKGEAVCVPEFTGVCYAWGDPHFGTVDKFKYNFQGTCRYIFSQTCGDLDGLVPYSVTESNENRGKKAVSFVREVELSVYGYSIIVRKNQVGKVTVDGELLNLPVRLEEDEKVVIVQKGREAQIKTDFGLIVTYDWHSRLVVKVPSSYYNHICGLCGNFNGNKKDELLDPEGKPVSSIAEWGKSWQTPKQDNSQCRDSCPDCPTCNADQLTPFETEDLCGALTAEAGVFQKCHDKVEPDAFMSGCAFDMCVNNGDRKLLCQALAAYSQECRDEGVVIQGWRMKFGCPMDCPRHSHYEECGSACQPSCPFTDQQPICPLVCIETCVCDEGYALSAGVCVLREDCGCSYQGRYYKPGQSFYEGQDCGRLCQCDTALGLVICRENSCSAKEKCTVVDGVRACRPTGQAVCSASGDPHHRTLDGRKFNFQGTCVYQLSALCSRRPGLVPFQVTLQNEHRGNRKSVSFAKVVTVSIYNVTVSLSREYPKKVLFNGQVESLPLVLGDDVQVLCGGRKAVVETAAGITVTFDWRSRVRVTVPSTYMDAVCGLCGNYNGDTKDDLTMPNGQAAANGAELGKSWQVGIVPGCSSICEGPQCGTCTKAAELEVYRAPKYCGIIADKAGPFKACHSKVDPAPFLEDCMFDACQFKGHPSAVCDAVGDYVAACQNAGVKILSWRTEKFCPMACRANSHYTLCATSCPATCASLTSVNCNRPCAETCECDEGFLLSGDTCVPVKDCGCSYDGHYYKPGDVFYPENECGEKCTCGQNGAVSCQKAKCRPGEECKVVNGVKGCHPEGQAKCVASGDPHYESLDGRKYDFQGTCIYVLSKVCDDDNGTLTPFTVTQGNEKYGNGKVSVTKSVGVEVYGFVIYIQQKVPWKVIVNEEVVNLPLTLHDKRIKITQEGRHIIVRTDFGLKVLYDTRYYVEVIVPSTYQDKMCGLCGNYNKNPADDFNLPGGQENNNIDNFAKAWAVDLPGFSCGGCGSQCPVCDKAKVALYSRPESCGIISAPNGPFKACHSKINPATYVSSCVFDVCANEGNKETLCNSVQSYALACQGAGVQIQAWRTNAFCPGSCPENSHYELCADTCGATCASLTEPVSCLLKTCIEGCECDQGFVFDGEQCVPVEACGCLYNGRYLTVGEAVVDEKCTSKCVCQASGAVKCDKLSCANGEICDVRKGIRDCHGKQGQCIITEATKLISFDGMSGAMGAVGAFEVASLCDLNEKSWFRLVLDVRTCSKGLTSVNVLYFFFRNAVVTVNSQRAIWVNGRSISAPFKVGCEGSVYVKADRSLVIQKGAMVQVTFSLSGEVIVELHSSLAEKACGACGNFNADSKDDLRTAKGKVSSSVSEVVASWRAEDFFHKCE